MGERRWSQFVGMRPGPLLMMGVYNKLVKTFGARWKWALQDSNLGPIGYEPTALTAELRARQRGNP